MIAYNDTYKGPRFTYGSLYRPFAEFWWDKWVIWSDKQHPDYAFGTMDSTEHIPDAKIRQWDIVLLT